MLSSLRRLLTLSSRVAMAEANERTYVLRLRPFVPSPPRDVGTRRVDAQIADSVDRDLPLVDVEEYIAAVAPHIIHYHGRLSREGFSNTFALGFIEDSDDLQHVAGLPEIEACFLAQKLFRCKALVQRWTPLLYHIPSGTSVRTWLSRLPVNLAMYSAVLRDLGFDSLAALKHLTDEDAREAHCSEGHTRVLLHCVRCIDGIPQDPPEPHDSYSIESWLSLLTPPLDHYSRTVVLCKKVSTVMDLITLSWKDVETLVMRRGHQRVLWHYIVATRAKWYDCV